MTFLHQHQGILIKKNDTEVSLLTFYCSQSGLSLCWCWLPTDRTEKSGDASSVSSNMVILFFPYSNLFLALSMMTLVFFITLYDSLLQSPSPLTTLTTCFATGPQTSTSMSWSMWWVKMMQAINSSIAIISQILQLLTLFMGFISESSSHQVIVGEVDYIRREWKTLQVEYFSLSFLQLWIFLLNIGIFIAPKASAEGDVF